MIQPKTTGRSSPLARRFSTAESISVSSRGPRRVWICCCSNVATMRAFASDFARSVPEPLVPLLAPIHPWSEKRDSFTPTASRGRMRADRLRFNPAKTLLDPYGRGVAVPAKYNHPAAAGTGENAAVRDEKRRRRSIHLRLGREPAAAAPSAQTIIYEMHVRGFTRHPSSGVAESKRGTYAGVIEKIPYLKSSALPPSS